MLPRLSRLAVAATTLIVAATLLPAAAQAGDLNRQQQALVKLLGAFELQLSRSVLDDVGPDVNRALINVANHREVRARVRVRAVAGLGFYPTDPSWKYLRGLLHEDVHRGTVFGTNLRRQALRSLGKAFGGRAVGEILALKDDPEPLIREAVAHALGDAKSPLALPELRQWLPKEPELHVRLAVDKAIEKILRSAGD